MKKTTMIAVLALVTLVFAGCASRGNQIEKISADSAKAIALEAAGISASEVTGITVELNDRNGQSYYDVDFRANGKEYDYDVDALTGTIISDESPVVSQITEENKTADDAKTQAIAEEPAANLTEAEVKEIALAQVPGATEDDIREFEVDYDDGRLEYEGKIIYDEMEYEFEIDGYSGAIRNWDVDSIYD